MNVLKRAFIGFSSDRVMANAAAVTFYVLLALFPAIAALIGIYGIFANPARLQDQVQALAGVVLGGGVEILQSQIASVAQVRTTLGWAAIVGVLASLWSANAGVKAFFDALNAVYDEEEKRKFLWLTATSLCFTMGLLVFAIVAIVAVIGTPILRQFVGLDWATDLLVRFGRWIGLIVVVDVVLAFLYRFGPSREKARWRWATWGSTFAAVLWIVLSVAFSYYVSHFGSYNKTYGSLGAVVGFMTWIWISSIVMLMGAEINAELKQQTERDSTEGPEKPMGIRGAYKADVKSQPDATIQTASEANKTGCARFRRQARSIRRGPHGAKSCSPRNVWACVIRQPSTPRPELILKPADQGSCALCRISDWGMKSTPRYQ